MSNERANSSRVSFVPRPIASIQSVSDSVTEHGQLLYDSDNKVLLPVVAELVAELVAEFVNVHQWYL